MADTKISALPSGNPAQTADQIPIARSGANYQITAGSVSALALATPLAVTGNATAGAEIRLPEDTDNGSNYVALKAADSIASNVTFTLPNADGTNGQFLKTDGSGVLSWASAGGGSGDVTGPASSVDSQIALFDSTTGKVIKAATTTGVLKASSGVIAAAVSGSDYAPATSGTSILKGSGTGGFSNAAAGTDYAPATSGTSILKGSGSGGFSNASAGTDYAAATTGTNAQLLANNGSGGFSNVTVGSGLTYSAGTLTSTGGGIAWQSVQTSGFTAVSNRAYPCNTTSTAFTVTLPASPSVGDLITLVDYAGTWGTNNLTVAGNGNKINGTVASAIFLINQSSVQLVYVDSTQGWKAYSFSVTPLTQPFSVDYLVVAGGGGGGDSGGGGAGGFSTGSLSVIGTVSYTVTVGGGGAGGPNDSPGNQGSPSVFSSVTSTGGGLGGGYAVANGGSGGSGGGGSGNHPSSSLGGSGTSGQGSNGGNGSATFWGGGGGGASAAGNSGINGTATGGNGTASSITGSSVTYAGGGGGGGSQVAGSNTSAGGAGGGGVGSATTVSGLKNGTSNTGGGAGGSEGASQSGGNGGSGVVIIAYPDTYPALASIGGGLTYDQPTRAGYRVYRFTAGTGAIAW